MIVRSLLLGLGAAALVSLSPAALAAKPTHGSTASVASVAKGHPKMHAAKKHRGAKKARRGGKAK